MHGVEIPRRQHAQEQDVNMALAIEIVLYMLSLL
jgi:hypothetical protein